MGRGETSEKESPADNVPCRNASFVAVFPFPSADRTEAVQSEGGMAAISQDDGTPGEYESYLEEKTADILRQVDGSGRSDGNDHSEIRKSEDHRERSVEHDPDDRRRGQRRRHPICRRQFIDKTSIYEQNSDGSSTPYVSKELTPEIEGVVVIADGG